MYSQERGKKLIHRKVKRDVPKETRPKEQDGPVPPKRPQSAYMLWLNAMRPQIKKENPGIGILDLARLAGQMWANVEDRQIWEVKADECKIIYEQEMAHFKATVRPNEINEAKVRKSKNSKRKRSDQHNKGLDKKTKTDLNCQSEQSNKLQCSGAKEANKVMEAFEGDSSIDSSLDSNEDDSSDPGDRKSAIPIDVTSSKSDSSEDC